MKEWLFGTSPAESALAEAAARLRGLNCAAGLLLGVPVFLLLSPLCGQLLARLPQPPGARQLLAGMLPIHVGMTLALAVLFLFLYPGRRWLPALELGRPPDGWRATAGASLKMLAWGYPAAIALYLLSLGVCALCGYTPAGSPVGKWLLAERDPLWFALAVAGVVVLAPLAEELLFRLALHDTFRFIGLPPAGAAWGAAVAFAAIHQLPAEVPALLFIGLLLQWRRQRDRSLWGAVVLHAGINGLSLVFLLGARWLL